MYTVSDKDLEKLMYKLNDSNYTETAPLRWKGIVTLILVDYFAG